MCPGIFELTVHWQKQASLCYHLGRQLGGVVIDFVQRKGAQVGRELRDILVVCYPNGPLEGDVQALITGLTLDQDRIVAETTGVGVLDHVDE